MNDTDLLAGTHREQYCLSAYKHTCTRSGDSGVLACNSTYAHRLNAGTHTHIHKQYMHSYMQAHTHTQAVHAQLHAGTHTHTHTHTQAVHAQLHAGTHRQEHTHAPCVLKQGPPTSPAWSPPPGSWRSTLDTTQAAYPPPPHTPHPLKRTIPTQVSSSLAPSPLLRPQEQVSHQALGGGQACMLVVRLRGLCLLTGPGPSSSSSSSSSSNGAARGSSSSSRLCHAGR